MGNQFQDHIAGLLESNTKSGERASFLVLANRKSDRAIRKDPHAENKAAPLHKLKGCDEN